LLAKNFSAKIGYLLAFMMYLPLPWGFGVQAKILVYGHDPLLLMTRGQLLEHAGFRVIRAQEFADAIQLTMNQHFDVLVLCQTLRADERQGMLAIAHAIQPPTKTLIFMVDEIPIPNVGTDDVVLEALARPFFVVIDQMLGSEVRVNPLRYAESPKIRVGER
jgi:hypothetical protein